MQKVIVLTTGGTISHRTQGGVAVLDFDPAALGTAVGVCGVALEFRSVFRKGSMDVVPRDWQVLAGAVAEAVAQQPCGIVILHGTDTMHYTAAALAFMLRGLSIPVVMTGSMIPGGDPQSDALPNLRDAIAVAATGELAEVCVVFSADEKRSRGVIIRGCRSKKIRSHGIAAFASINVPAIGAVVDGRIVRSELQLRPRAATTLRLATALDGSAVLIKLTPNLTATTLARMLHGAAGAVLEGTGAGHIRTDLQPVIADFGRPAVITTQAVEGGERLGAYAVDRDILAIPHLIRGGDMSSETALVKLMWALKQDGDVNAIMQSDIAGEITTPRARLDGAC